MKIDFDQMCVYNKVAKYKITAECRTPLHIGSGNGSNGEVLIHPVKDVPFVQATGIAGALREFYSEDEVMQKKLFGFSCRETDDAEEKDAEGGSRVYFTDGFFLGPEYSKNLLSDRCLTDRPQSAGKQIRTEIRPRLKIDPRTGTGQFLKIKGSERCSGQKFEIESVALGSQFSFSIYLYEKDENLEYALESGLKALHRGEIQLGGQKSNGCGYVELLAVEKAVYDLCDREDRRCWADENKKMTDIVEEITNTDESDSKWIHIELSGRTKGSILVKAIAVTEYGKDKPASVNIRNHRKEYLLPASSIKGVIRSHVEKIAIYMDIGKECVTELFGKKADEDGGKTGKLRFYDSVIGESKENENASLQHRLHIDKFTGSVMYGGLFTEKPAYGDITIGVDIKKDSEWACGLILMALRDIAMGILPLGSGSSIGRGYFDGDLLVVSCGKRKLLEIDCKTKKILSGQEQMNQYLQSLRLYKEG